MLRVLSFLGVAAFCSAWSIPSYQYSQTPRNCEAIKVPLCQSNGSTYSLTRLPNFMGDTEQDIIRVYSEQKEVKDLIKTNCSKDLVFFLCATLLPICIDDARFTTPPIVRPCRGLCWKVYKDCKSSMKKLNFEWPANLNCSTLPVHATGMCIKPSIIIRANGKRVKLKASCDNKLQWKKDDKLTIDDLKKYDHIFRAKLVSSSGHGKSRFRLSVQRFFTPKMTTSSKTLIYAKRCSKNSSNRKVFLVLAKDGKGDLDFKISVMAEWKGSYTKLLRKYARNMQRRGTKG